MKFRIFLILLAVVLLFGCVTSDENIGVVSEDRDSEAELPVQSEEPVVKEPVKIITIEYNTILEESYFGDGVLDEYRVFTYDDSGEIFLKEELFNSDQDLMQSTVIEYSNSLTSIRRIYDAAGDILSYSKSDMDKNGNLLKKENFNSKDVLLSRSEYEYVNGLKGKWNVFNTSGSLMNTTIYYYEDNNLVRIENLGSSGKVEEYFEIAYNDNGKMLTDIHYDSEGRIESSRSFEYEGGFLIMEKYYRPNGSVKRKIMYKNDQFGNRIETIYMDAGDNVQERILREFKSREVISYEE